MVVSHAAVQSPGAFGTASPLLFNSCHTVRHWFIVHGRSRASKVCQHGSRVICRKAPRLNPLMTPNAPKATAQGRPACLPPSSRRPPSSRAFSLLHVCVLSSDAIAQLRLQFNGVVPAHFERGLERTAGLELNIPCVGHAAQLDILKRCYFCHGFPFGGS